MPRHRYCRRKHHHLARRQTKEFGTLKEDEQQFENWKLNCGLSDSRIRKLDAVEDATRL